MVDKIHCPECGFLMMTQSQGNTISYVCVNTHDSSIEDNGMGNNADILLQYLKGLR